VIVRVSATGEKFSSVRVANDPVTIAAAVAEAGPNSEVVLDPRFMARTKLTEMLNVV
jgi:hypothetical protein